MDLSSVQNCILEINQTLENAQSDKINTTHNKGKAVSTPSIISGSAKLNLKKFKKRKSNLKRKSSMKTMYKFRGEENKDK